MKPWSCNISIRDAVKLSAAISSHAASSPFSGVQLQVMEHWAIQSQQHNVAHEEKGSSILECIALLSSCPIVLFKEGGQGHMTPCTQETCISQTECSSDRHIRGKVTVMGKRMSRRPITKKLLYVHAAMQLCVYAQMGEPQPTCTKVSPFPIE